uniref:Uncharacterized protein n=1 Tax=Triticum urartu TaxID=4572 RepID=A0A8R7QZ65_TRIUA
LWCKLPVVGSLARARSRQRRGALAQFVWRGSPVHQRRPTSPLPQWTPRAPMWTTPDAPRAVHSLSCS